MSSTQSSAILYSNVVMDTVVMKRVEAKVIESRIYEPLAPELDADDARRSTIAMLGSRVAIAAMGWGGSVLIARTLSPDEWGQFSLVFGLLGLLSVVTDLGVGRVVLNKLVECNPWEVSFVTTAFIALRIALGFLGYLLAVGYVLLLGYSSDVVWATVVAGLVVVVATPSHALSVMFQSRLRMTYVAVAETLGQFGQLIFTIAAALWAPVLIIFVIPALINEIIGAVVKIRGVRAGIAGPLPSSRAQFHRWREMLIEAVPLSIGFALVTLLSKIDVLLLGKLDSFDSVGMYTIGYKFADLLQIVAMTIVTPVTTLLVATWPAQPHIFRQRTREAAMLLLILGSAATAAFWPTATEVLGLLYGSRFAAADSSTRLLVLGGAMSMLTQLGLMVLVATGRHKVYPWVALGALAINVALNVALIPQMSFLGAAVATVATEAALLAAIWFVVVRTVPVRGLFPVGAAVGIGLLGTAVTVWASLFVDKFGVPWIVVAVLAPLLVLAGAHYLPVTGGIRLVELVKTGRGSNDTE